MYKRPQFATLAKKLREPRRCIQVINGPRHVGKATLARQLIEELGMVSHFVSTADAPGAGLPWISQQWETARQKMNSSNQTSGVLVIGEIQKIKDWDWMARENWGKDTRNGIDLKVILLGTTRLLQQRAITPTLNDCFEVTHLPHWSLVEMQNGFGFSPEQFVWFGGYPGAAALIDDEARWKDYVRNSILETTIVGDIHKIAHFHKRDVLWRVFQKGCALSGKIVPLTTVREQMREDGHANSLSYHFDLLDLAGLIVTISNYLWHEVRLTSSIPKIQVLNTASQSVFSAFNFEQALETPDLWGQLVESAIGAHLANAARRTGMLLNYWHHLNQDVDFVLEKNGRQLAIELQYSTGKKLSGMVGFLKMYPLAKSLLVGPEGMSWQQFLATDPEDLF